MVGQKIKQLTYFIGDQSHSAKFDLSGRPINTYLSDARPKFFKAYRNFSHFYIQPHISMSVPFSHWRSGHIEGTRSTSMQIGFLPQGLITPVVLEPTQNPATLNKRATVYITTTACPQIDDVALFIQFQSIRLIIPEAPYSS